MVKSINLYENESEYESNYENRPKRSLNLIRENKIIDIHVKTGFVTFTAEEAGSTIRLNKLSSYQTLEYTDDNVFKPSPVWKSMDINTVITLNNVGDKVCIRGVLSRNNTNSDYTQFNMTGKIAAIGNCNALWSKNDLNAPLKSYCGYRMFQGCTGLT